MPLYQFVCGTCSERTRRIMKHTEPRTEIPCPKCAEGVLVRDETPPSTQMMETLDNGAMPKKLERLQNAEELHRDRAKADPRLKRV